MISQLKSTFKAKEENEPVLCNPLFSVVANNPPDHVILFITVYFQSRLFHRKAGRVLI